MSLAMLAAAFTLAGLLPPTPSPSPGGVEVGKPAPSFVISGLDGKPLGPVQPLRHGVFVFFFTTACDACRAQTPNIIAEFRRFHDRVTFLGVDEREAASKVIHFVHESRVPYPVGIDAGQNAATLGVTTLPHSIFIDRRGVIRAVTGRALTRSELNSRLAEIAS